MLFRFLLILVAAVALAGVVHCTCASVGDELQSTQKSNARVLKHPGPDTAAVIDFLTRIRVGRAKAERMHGDMLIRGRTSFVNLAWKDGLGEQTAESLPTPDWCSSCWFERARCASIRSMSRSFRARSSLPPFTDSWTARLYSLNLKSLEILAPEDERGMWEELADGYFGYGQVHDGVNAGPLAATCQRLIDRITNDKHAGFWKDRELRCFEGDGLLVVENSDPARKTDRRYDFRVDPGAATRCRAAPTGVEKVRRSITARNQRSKSPSRPLASSFRNGRAGSWPRLGRSPGRTSVPAGSAETWKSTTSRSARSCTTTGYSNWKACRCRKTFIGSTIASRRAATSTPRRRIPAPSRRKRTAVHDSPCRLRRIPVEGGRSAREASAGRILVLPVLALSSRTCLSQRDPG